MSVNVDLRLGDCLDVLRGMEPGSVDAVITDPPYGINTKSDGLGKLSPWADLCNAAFWYAEWIGECRRVLKPTGCLWSCLNWRSLVTFQKAACDVRWPIESLMVWNKGWIGPGGSKGLRPAYELVALWCMPEFAIANRGLRDVQEFRWCGHKPNGHPAEKPVDMAEWMIDIASAAPVAGTVLDPFMGSGSFGVAAVNTGRNFVGVEMDAEHYATACRRIEAARNATPLFA